MTNRERRSEMASSVKTGRCAMSTFYILSRSDRYMTLHGGPLPRDGHSEVRMARGRRRAAELDAAALGRTGAVVRLRGYVRDRADLKAGGLERTDRGFAARAGALNENVDLLHSVFLGATRGRLSSHLRGERGGLPGALKANLARRSPGNYPTGGIGDGNNGVVKRALDVSMTVRDIFLIATTRLTHRSLSSLGRHMFVFLKKSKY